MGALANASSLGPTNRATVFVHLLPSLLSPGLLRGGIAVVVDVLRATTVMVHALASGCAAVIPCGEIAEARRVAAGWPGGAALLGGERGGRPIPGFDLGNSPGEFTPEVCRGKTLVMTTTNGTRAILACLEAQRVYVASFTNLGAMAGELVVRWLGEARGLPVHIVCAGTEGSISLEDSWLAGALVNRLDRLCLDARGEPVLPGNDAALLVAEAWRCAAERTSVCPLEELLKQGRGGHNVQRIGLAGDLAAAAAIDRHGLVAVLCRDPLQIVAV